MQDAITFRPVGAAGMTCEVRSPHGRKPELSGTLKTVEPEASGDEVMTSNPALVHNAWACAKHDQQYRRLKDPEKRKSHLDGEDLEPESIAVLVRSQDERDRFVRGLGERGVTVRAVDRNAASAGQPLVMTMHPAKGMEFTRVILSGADDKYVPSPATLRHLPDEERAEALLRERSLLYVASSRAWDALVVTWSGRRSELLGATPETTTP